MYKLRPYQQECVDSTIRHFQIEHSPAVIVLPTGAGKSIVIAELARIARGRVLILAHVKELVEQNHAKFHSLNLKAGIYSAGLNQKDMSEKVIFGSIQSVARAPKEFFSGFSLLIIDECHRVSFEEDTQYSQVISQLQAGSERLCILGLTATPYRLGMGWIYRQHVQKKIIRTEEERFFDKCLYELSLSYMIKNGFLTPPLRIDSPVASYDFSSLKLHGSRFVFSEIETLLKDQKRITPVIIKNIIDVSADRKGVMIFTSSINHAEEIMRSLPPFLSAMVIGDTESRDREEIINAFKAQKIKYLVNVSVLTTGFDAPHVDVIALLRPTESVSLYQQIIGRGLRLSEGKSDCLILDYTGQGHNIFSPEIGEDRPSQDSSIVEVPCPVCGLINEFWGLCDKDGDLIEHYGRKCQGIGCGFRFRFKLCDSCGSEQDIAARVCQDCRHLLVDTDKKLKEIMSLKDAHVMRVDSMDLVINVDKKFHQRLEVHYYDADGEALKEYFSLKTQEELKAFQYHFLRMHDRLPGKFLSIKCAEDVLSHKQRFRSPQFVVARKKNQYWEVREKVF